MKRGLHKRNKPLQIQISKKHKTITLKAINKHLIKIKKEQTKTEQKKVKQNQIKRQKIHRQKNQMKRGHHKRNKPLQIQISKKHKTITLKAINKLLIKIKSKKQIISKIIINEKKNYQM